MDNDDFARVIGGSGQILALGSASVMSAPFGSQTFAVRLAATGACHVEFGVAPVATASSPLIAANAVGEYFKVQPGEKVAVIQDGAATGNLSIVEVSR